VADKAFLLIGLALFELNHEVPENPLKDAHNVIFHLLRLAWGYSYVFTSCPTLV